MLAPMKKRLLLTCAAALICLAALGCWFCMWLSWDRVNLLNYARMQAGMSIEEVETMLCDKGLSYSSDTAYGYYIWKGRSAWIHARFEQGKMTAKSFRFLRLEERQAPVKDP